MSSVGAICKDDNSGEARVFVKQGTGTPPYQFDWDFDWDFDCSEVEDESDNSPVDSFSVIKGLCPGTYFVYITDAMGCIVKDSIEVKSNPNICISPYKAFSPNDDDTHEFWEIENIELYPEAVISIYNRNGSQIYRRRNYENAERVAFGGKNAEGQPIPSGTYYFIIDLDNGDDVFKGTLTIVR
jgi:gliding motility-associated-like protein